MGCQAIDCPVTEATISAVNSPDWEAHPGQKKEMRVAARKNQGQKAKRSRRAIPAKIDSPVAMVHRSISWITTNCVITPTQKSHQIW